MHMADGNAADPLARPVAGAAGHARTRQRLIDAAGAVFAEHGYREATVRAICRRAGANIAAVNYHFGDKRELYKIVLQQSVVDALRRYPPDMDLDETADAGARLRAFVRSLLFRMLDSGRPAWHGKLMAREMVEPTEALDELVEHVIRPLLARLRSILAELLDASDPMLLRHCVSSVISQCLFYQQARPMVQRLMPEQQFTCADIEALAEHITRFSLAALAGLRSRRHSAGCSGRRGGDGGAKTTAKSPQTARPRRGSPVHR